MSRIGDAILHTLLEEITDYENVNLTQDELEVLSTRCDDWEDRDSVETEINKFLLEESYTYDSDTFKWNKKD